MPKPFAFGSGLRMPKMPRKASAGRPGGVKRTDMTPISGPKLGRISSGFTKLSRGGKR